MPFIQVPIFALHIGGRRQVPNQFPPLFLINTQNGEPLQFGAGRQPEGNRAGRPPGAEQEHMPAFKRNIRFTQRSQRPTGVGIVAAELALAELDQLFGRGPKVDPAVLGGVAGLMTFVAIAATLVPARRAAKADPVKAMRADCSRFLRTCCRMP